MTSNRMRRVDELMRRELGSVCEREVVPQLDSLLTITGVKTAPDLRQATVFFSVLGDDAQKKQALRVLLRARRTLQREVAARIALKYTPVLEFRFDDSIATGDRVLQIIEGLDITDSSADDLPASGQ